MSYVNKDCDVTMLAILRERGGATRARRGGATLVEGVERRAARGGRQQNYAQGEGGRQQNR